MWTYNKVLQYPINIKCPNPKLAKFIISQYGGPDGELAASLRYLSQRFGMPDQKSKAVLNDIGTEELEKAGLGAYYTDHGVDVYPQSAAGTPWTAAYIACKGDPIANLQEDLAADKKDFKCNQN
jgi:spore coat protein JC